MADEQFTAAATALEEYQSIEEQMASPEVVSNPDKLRKLGRRHAELGAIVGAYKAWLQVKDDLAAAQEMAGEDADFAEEAKRLEDELPGVEEKLRTALIPRDPDDARDTIMEIKAGTGGEEAALFAGDLLNQCVCSSFAARDLSLPFFGLYGACSTMGEGLCLSSLVLDSGGGQRAAVLSSSHFCSAERQYRTPLEYGCQRTPTA